MQVTDDYWFSVLKPIRKVSSLVMLEVPQQFPQESPTSPDRLQLKPRRPEESLPQFRDFSC